MINGISMALSKARIDLGSAMLNFEQIFLRVNCTAKRLIQARPLP